METYNLKNSWFADGWHKWELNISDANAVFTTTDSVKNGLMTSYESPNGFPTVGEKYILFSRSFDSENENGVTGKATLIHEDTNAFNEGDVIEFDFGLDVTTATGTFVLNVQLGTWNGAAFTAIDQIRYDQIDPDWTQPVRLAYRFAADITSQLAIRFSVATFATGRLVGSWACIDNIFIYSASDYLDPVDGNDTSGVT